MKTRVTAVAAQFTGRAAAPAAPQATARPGCLPPPPPTQTVAEDQHSQVTPAPHKRVRWTIVLAGVLVLLAGTLAAKRINFYRPPAVASYNTRLAELDNKLAQALASQLRAARVPTSGAGDRDGQSATTQRRIPVCPGMRSPVIRPG